jgi:hypothetical protein
VTLLRDRKRKIDTAARLVGAELLFNGEALSLGRGAGSELSISAWEQHRAEVLGLRDSELVDAVVQAYADLQRTIVRGAEPPSAAHITALGEKLRAERFGRF